MKIARVLDVDPRQLMGSVPDGSVTDESVVSRKRELIDLIYDAEMRMDESQLSMLANYAEFIVKTSGEER